MTNMGMRRPPQRLAHDSDAGRDTAFQYAGAEFDAIGPVFLGNDQPVDSFDRYFQQGTFHCVTRGDLADTIGEGCHANERSKGKVGGRSLFGGRLSRSCGIAPSDNAIKAGLASGASSGER